MENLSFDDEYLVVVTTGLVSSIRKKYSQIDGFWRVAALVLFIALVVSLIKYLSNGNTFVDISSAVYVLVKTLWIAILSLTGVTALTYLIKKNGSKNDNDI